MFTEDGQFLKWFRKVFFSGKKKEEIDSEVMIGELWHIYGTVCCFTVALKVRGTLASMLKLIYYSIAIWSIATLLAFALKVLF